jgi:hypothetical protein
MSGPPYRTVDDLPPRPDAVTGLPRPPHGPGYLGFEGLQEPNDHIRGLDARPNPPPGQGPVLAWFRGGMCTSAVVAGLGTAFVAAYPTISVGTDWITDPAEYWFTWLILAITFIGCYVRFRSMSVSAGADWLAKRGRWVRTYELTGITYHSCPGGTGVFLLRDSGGRRHFYRWSELGEDRLLWDLTYNGIAHSVIAGGAKTNKYARNILRLPEPVDGVPEPEPPATPNNHPHSGSDPTSSTLILGPADLPHRYRERDLRIDDLTSPRLEHEKDTS